MQVAEGLSNLAIMHNQQGDYARAQPLYERALVIWEKTRGPDHADVAHTLTDLAVLHLEQVSLKLAHMRKHHDDTGKQALLLTGPIWLG